MICKIQSKNLGLCLIVAFCGGLAHANNLQDEYEAKEPWEQYLIQKNITTSEWFDGIAEGLDLFFAGKRYTKKPNETSATVESSAFYNEADGSTATINFNVDLRLPNVEEYWHLAFTSYDERETRGARDRYLRQTPRTRNYGASIGFFKNLGNVRTAFRPRVSFEGAPAISHSLVLESVAEKPRGYRVNPKLEFYVTPSKGAGSFQSLNFNFELSKIYSLTFINEGDYESKIHLYTLTHGVSFVNRVNRKAFLAYNIFLTFINNPNHHLSGYNFSVAWNHTIYKKILNYEVLPNLDFSQDRSWVGNPGITLHVNLNF